MHVAARKDRVRFAWLILASISVVTNALCFVVILSYLIWNQGTSHQRDSGLPTLMPYVLLTTAMSSFGMVGVVRRWTKWLMMLLVILPLCWILFWVTVFLVPMRKVS
jgi:peptidoglycan biosynthesis protein MviN/MurJ (putative lipid II flippase)